MSVAVLLPTYCESKNIESLSVAVLLPTYCESENIESLIREIEKLPIDVSIVVVDDSSPDGTPEIVKKLGNEYGNIFLFSRPEKQGLGTAITSGFRSILQLKNHPDYIIAMDADYSHNPHDIPKLVNTAKMGYDLVIGSRYIDGGHVIGSRLWRRLVSRVANFVATITVRTGLFDCTSGFRCYSNRYVKKVLPNLHSQTYEIQIETIKQARKNKFKVKEVPITFVDRKKGKSKLARSEITGFLTYIIKALVGDLLSLAGSR